MVVSYIAHRSQLTINKKMGVNGQI